MLTLMSWNKVITENKVLYDKKTRLKPCFKGGDVLIIHRFKLPESASVTQQGFECIALSSQGWSHLLFRSAWGNRKAGRRKEPNVLLLACAFLA